ncbi:MAG: 1-deoxy-D-xylulose-5-phosphate reductoisomerase [Candidatus Latescibacterota bacterium]|nr:MAG: 1-deoxy-D-xylulose-5-phosphate reductoisomerase [Candidatus Latescibacterota bacterium]
MKRVVVLGSTGSVGRQTLDIVRAHPERFQVVGLSAGSNVDLLAQQIDEFEPQVFAIADEAAGDEFLARDRRLRSACAGLGATALCDVARVRADIVVNALLGYAGLEPTLAALEAGTDVALSNKETLVVAGALVRHAADATGARILPVDSEHSAILQCLRAGERREVRRLILTASGGPFRTHSREEMRRITRQEALRHPTWSMGAKITVDSATLMNKGLEVLEAHWLFDVEFDRIDILVHPESIVHSLVEFDDGSVIAQLGLPDMRLPIWYALHAPARPEASFATLDLAAVGRLHFESLDHERFPCVALAIGAGRRGGVYPAILNAANEVAVAAFLDERLRYLDIPDLIDTVLKEAGAPAPARLDHGAIRDADAWAREVATRHILQGCPTGDPPC